MAKWLLLYSLFAVQAVAQISPHGDISLDCQSCHNTDSWTLRTDASFDHASVDFPLVGQHAVAKCQSCHEELKFTAQSSNCSSCHVDVHKAELGPTCARCHNNQSWRIADMVSRHQQSRFPLLGRHATLDCQSCHVRSSENQYVGTPTECATCHGKDFHEARNPDHLAAGFNADCEQCHDVSAFTWGRGFDHSATAFALEGAHGATRCVACHTNQQFKATPHECVACHRTDFTETVNPNHTAAEFSTDCRTCHRATNWEAGQFDHNQTLFVLTGAHQQQECSGCHGDNVFVGRSVECVACHLSAFNTTVNPNHIAGGFPQLCQQCHTTTAWVPSWFSHINTNFPLTGAHQVVTCGQCHTNNQYQGTPTDCFSCHQLDYANAVNPNHVANGFSQTCAQCHTTGGWSPALFDHAATDFPLSGAHVSLQCQSCHLSGNYQLVYTECYQCHQDDFQVPLNPNHALGNFGHDCQPCHTTVAWLPSTFSHSSTPFPLTGAHQATSCNQCHVNNQYAGLPSACFDCHASDFQNATNPNHVANNFSHECAQCHITGDWSPATFDHALTDLPLTGAHVPVPCITCHVDGNYQLVYTDCYQCHQNDFQVPLNPNHALGNFNHDCQPCHTTTAWLPSTFSHANTTFPLTGAHQAVACSDCHVNNQYQGLPTACYDCHMEDFQNTTNPNHVAGNFDHDCTQCHSTGGWTPATFNHSNTNFPLTGAHGPLQCQSCHVNGNYNLVYNDCYQCHQSDYTIPTNPNHLTLLFSHQCDQCHTTNVWDPSTFNHDLQYFRIYSGRHQNEWTSCQQCHPTLGSYELFTCISCHEHNQPDMDDEHNGVSGYVYSSPACYDCHRNVVPMRRG